MIHAYHAKKTRPGASCALSMNAPNLCDFRVEPSIFYSGGKKWESQETPKRILKRSPQKPLRKNARRSRKRKNNSRSHLKKSFRPIRRRRAKVSALSPRLKSSTYLSMRVEDPVNKRGGLTLGPVSISNENPNFEMASNKLFGTLMCSRICCLLPVLYC
jgi:hypothetical protein